MGKYQTLVNILDRLRSEVPATFKTYHPLPSDIEKVEQARSKAFIHLFLKVRFGLLTFEERQKFFTDGKDDGGVDAYYIDKDQKKIFLIQAKFRTNEKNFEAKEIELKEILKIEADRIAAGETEDEDGKAYSPKILAFQETVQSLANTADYDWEVVLLANLKRLKHSTLVKYTGGISTQVFNFERTYVELVFPVASGTFYNFPDLYVTIDLTNKEVHKSTINYSVRTERAECEIAVIFVPTSEIGRILHKYRNSMLVFNPRNYLDLGKNQVNREIEHTIAQRKSNEFALFNNGITVLSESTRINPNTGRKGVGQLYIRNPQIINGGQTAFTLSRIYAELVESGSQPDVFRGKEVMLKVITISPKKVGETDKLSLIEAISKATNQQTPVDEADRRSNDKVQVELQKNLFKTFGFFYERKRGEFLDAVCLGYVDREKIIDRQIAMRICCARKGLVSEARRQSVKQLFQKSEFNKLLDHETDHRMVFYGFACFTYLKETQKTFSRSANKFGVANFGQGLRYGKYAIVSIVLRSHKPSLNTSDYPKIVKIETDKILAKWLDFEEYAAKQKHNGAYFQETDQGKVLDYDGYYKGRTLGQDLEAFKF